MASLHSERGKHIPSKLMCVSESSVNSVELVGDTSTFFGKSSFTLGSTSLTIPSYLIVNSTVDLGSVDADDIIIVNQDQRILSSVLRFGTYKVLVVRVVDNEGNEPKHSIAELGEKTFDDNRNLVRMQKLKLYFLIFITSHIHFYFSLFWFEHIREHNL